MVSGQVIAWTVSYRSYQYIWSELKSCKCSAMVLQISVASLWDYWCNCCPIDAYCSGRHEKDCIHYVMTYDWLVPSCTIIPFDHSPNNFVLTYVVILTNLLTCFFYCGITGVNAAQSMLIGLVDTRKTVCSMSWPLTGYYHLVTWFRLIIPKIFFVLTFFVILTSSHFSSPVNIVHHRKKVPKKYWHI